MKFLLAADIHIRDTTPRARKDDYWLSQWESWSEILDIFTQRECDFILVAGDLGDKAEWSDWLINTFLRVTEDKIGKKRDIIVVPGQHDLLHHQRSEFHKTGLGLLKQLKMISVLDEQNKFNAQYRSSKESVYIHGYWYGDKLPKREFKTRKDDANRKITRILLLHKMIIKEPLWPGQIATKHIDFFEKHPEFDLIVSGDNHQSIKLIDGRMKGHYRALYNSGSMMRMRADQVDHKPQVGIYDTLENTLKTVYLKENIGEISREHLVADTKRKEMAASIAEARFQPDSSIKIRPKAAFESYFKENKVKKSVKNIIWRSME